MLCVQYNYTLNQKRNLVNLFKDGKEFVYLTNILFNEVIFNVFILD